MKINNNSCYKSFKYAVKNQSQNNSEKDENNMIPINEECNLTTDNANTSKNFIKKISLKKKQVKQELKINNKMLNSLLDLSVKLKSSPYVHSQTCRVPFSQEEDKKLKELANKYGKNNWSTISTFMNGRTPKQCRDRYCNYLTPGNFTGQWSNEEDELIIKLYREYGPKWSIIKKSFPCRSSNSIKNRWKFFLCRQNSNQPNSNGLNIDENINNGQININNSKINIDYEIL